MLSLQDVHVHIGKLHILQGVSLDVQAGESAALLGRNGVGKTTTLRAIMGLAARSRGTIAFDGFDLARCAAHPDTLWCQHHNAVFRSEDAGASWHELTAIRPSKFGFAVAAHPRDPQTAWFIPAAKDERRVPVDGELVVARTTDGGASFEVLREGLPQRHAYDLVYRHALDVDQSGEVLAFGSTTGGLWISENGGDSWSAVEARLPPVAVVRFAA